MVIEREYVTVKEAAVYTGMSEETIRILIRLAEFKRYYPTPTGRTIRLKLSDINAYMEKVKKPPKKDDAGNGKAKKGRK